MKKSMSLGQIAAHIDGKADGDPSLVICGVASFDEASSDELTFASGAKFLNRLHSSPAGAVVAPLNAPAGAKPLIRVENPALAFARAAWLFVEKPPVTGIAKSAVIADDFVCGKDPSIGPGVVIGKGVKAGDCIRIGPNTVIGDNVRLGDGVCLNANVTIYHGCILGSRVIVHSGTVIGADGFGYASDGLTLFKIPQTGIVQIGDDVEIGANNTIDRATFGKTLVGSGVKTDNLVHIAHNVIVGENAVLIAQAGVSGSTKIGRNAVLGGQAGIAGHLEIGDFAFVGPQSGIAKDVEAGAVVSGSPAMPHRLWLKVSRIISNLPQLRQQIGQMSKRLDALEEKADANNM
ncbi:MAG: UDP-3-O-(3-hydroxymyristoyl)glucosamine N-acyltransferase [Desulfatibacillaceae bacterium]|nr:UDP-3-O-(3-hydroxymyristoyl)glucosamine N-acyltransferase [Desulfatibacillaceae bacterium]